MSNDPCKEALLATHDIRKYLKQIPLGQGEFGRPSILVAEELDRHFAPLCSERDGLRKAAKTWSTTYAGGILARNCDVHI